MQPSHTIHRSVGRKISSWEFILDTLEGGKQAVTFDVVMKENFPTQGEPPRYFYTASLAKGQTVNVNDYQLDRLAAPTLEELWKLVHAAAQKFENLNWEPVIIVGFEWCRGSHNQLVRNSGSTVRVTMATIGNKHQGAPQETKFSFDFVIAEQAGVWFRVDKTSRLQRAAHNLLAGFYGSDVNVFVLPYSEATLAQLVMLRDKFHQLGEELEKMLNPTNIVGFLEGLEQSRKLLK